MRDLNKKIPGAPNFTYGELIKSNTALRKGITNIPNDHQWENIERLAKNILQPIRKKFGLLRINSGFRSVELCEAIGSNKNSNHARGEAADIEPISSNIPLIDVLTFIHDELDYRELIAEHFIYGWVHVAYRENGNDRILKLKDAEHNYSLVTLDDIKKIYK